MASRYVVFSHGKESGPWGTKISAMADVARGRGWHAESVDYRGIDDPQERVTRLLSSCRDLQGDLVLAGSSLGGHVATSASVPLRARGLFLLAPAFYMPGHEHLTPSPAPCPVTIVHGWHDDVVPVDHSIRYARRYAATLHVIAADHRMQDDIARISGLFEHFLGSLDAVHAASAR
jgi:predicted esterase